MKKRKKIILICGGVFVCILALSLLFRDEGQDALDAVNRITTFSCSEVLTQKLGETDSEALKEQLAEMLTVEVFEREQENVFVKIVSDYAEAAFYFETEREVTAKEYGILLEIVGFEHRFYGEDHLVDLYLQIEDVNYLLGTAWIEDKVYFLPLGENGTGVFFDDGEIRKMLEKYEEECDWWEYICVDGWEGDDTLLVRSAQEVVSELPGRVWEAAEGSEKEILLDEDTRIICLDLKDGHEEGYCETSFKNLHSILKEGGSNVFFVGWKDGKVECMINIFIS